MAKLSARFPVYSRLLKLYPTRYQERYGEQMLQTLADMLDANSSATGRLLVWLRATRDFPASLFSQQWAYAGTVLSRETPRFVQRNALVSGLLFVPFFAIATANDLVAHRLYHTWLWSFDVLVAWIVLLPAFGLLLSTATLFAWLRLNKRSWWQSLRDIAHNWMMLLPILLGVGILSLVFFHDSVHCVTGNPVRELHNPHATLRCVEQR